MRYDYKSFIKDKIVRLGQNEYFLQLLDEVLSKNISQDIEQIDKRTSLILLDKEYEEDLKQVRMYYNELIDAVEIVSRINIRDVSYNKSVVLSGTEKDIQYSYGEIVKGSKGCVLAATSSKMMEKGGLLLPNDIRSNVSFFDNRAIDKLGIDKLDFLLNSDLEAGNVDFDHAKNIMQIISLLNNDYLLPDFYAHISAKLNEGCEEKDILFDVIKHIDIIEDIENLQVSIPIDEAQSLKEVLRSICIKQLLGLVKDEMISDYVSDDLDMNNLDLFSFDILKSSSEQEKGKRLVLENQSND